MKKRGKSDFWNRREAFARAIERDTKEKSEEVAQRLAQAVRADEEKQAKKAARAGARGRSGQTYTQADTWNAKENSPVRTKISALGETAGGTRPDTDGWGGTTHTGAYEWEKAPGLHTMELRIPGAGLTGTQPGGMMEEISRRVAAAVQPGSLELKPSSIGPLQKPENLPGFIDETAVPGEGLVPYGVNGAESAVQLLRAAPQKLQAEQGKSNALLTGQLSQMQPTDEYIPPDYTDPQWWMDWVDSTHEGHPMWNILDAIPLYQSVLSRVQGDQAEDGRIVKNVLLDIAGHHPIAGSSALETSDKAALGKMVLFPNDPNLNIDGAKPNAFLHAFWNAQMAYRIGPEMAETFATAYEAYRDEEYEEGILNTIDPDTGLTVAQNIVMDMHNNSVGRSLAAKMPDTPEAIHEELFSRYGSEEAIQQALELCQGFDEADLLLFHYTTEAMDAGQLQWLYE